MRPLIVALAMLCAPAALAQAVIDPGMSREQVVERLGKPVGERSVGDHTYMFYRNGCERRCGMHDVVTLAGGSVVDAVFRSASRRYTGESSSPAGRAPVNSAAPGSAEGAAGAQGGGGVITGGPQPPAGRARRAVEPAVRGSSAGSVVPDSAARPADSSRAPRPPLAAGGQPAAGYRTDTIAAPGAPLRAGSGNRAARPAPNYRPNPADSVRNANAQRQPPDSVRPPEI